MKNYTHSNLRNIALVAHASSGKTMLGECMLACSDNINRLGSVTEGTTASDYHKSEQERQFSIHTSLLHAEWMERRFNIIDTPGNLDFIAESRAALKVSDLAVVVVHATHGIEIGKRCGTSPKSSAWPRWWSSTASTPRTRSTSQSSRI